MSENALYFKKAEDIGKSTMQLCWPRNSGLHYDLCSRVAAAAAAALGTRMVQSKEEQCVEQSEHCCGSILQSSVKPWVELRQVQSTTSRFPRHQVFPTMQDDPPL